MTTHVPPRFREDNTEGYGIDELRELNRRYDAAVNHAIGARPWHKLTDLEFKSLSDRIAERVLADFDARKPADC